MRNESQETNRLRGATFLIFMLKRRLVLAVPGGSFASRGYYMSARW